MYNTPIIPATIHGKRFDSGDYIEFSIQYNTPDDPHTLITEYSRKEDFSIINKIIYGVEVYRNSAWTAITSTSNINLGKPHRFMIPKTSDIVMNLYYDGTSLIDASSASFILSDVSDMFTSFDWEYKLGNNYIPINEGTSDIGKFYVRIRAVNDNDTSDVSYSNTEMIRIGKVLNISSTPVNTTTIAKLIMIIGTHNIDSHATVQVLASNNANDTTPVWEDVTKYYLNKILYPFKNTVSTGTPAISLKFIITANDSTNEISLSSHTFSYS